MSFIPSCGHEIKGYEGPFGFGWDTAIMSDGYDEQGHYRSVIHGNVCTKCYNEMKKAGILLNEKECEDWLNSGKIPKRLQNK